MKTLRRMTTNPVTGELGMNTLYEYHAKVGTTGSTLVWLYKKPVVGETVFGYCEEDRYTPYMGGHAFRYAEAQLFYVTKIGDMDGEEFVFLNKN